MPINLPPIIQAEFDAATLQKRPFGATLGDNDREAGAQLRQVLTAIENGSFMPPSEARKRPFAKSSRVPSLTLRQLVNEYLTEKRKVRGRETARNYSTRLGPVLEFAEQPASMKRWSLAADIDRHFVIDLGVFLQGYQTTRNGRPGGPRKLLSPRQIINIKECLRSALAWARQPQVRKLPLDWVNPVTPDLVGSPPAKDPFRVDLLPLELRIALVNCMDAWQLCHLSPSVVLPLRPDEAVGLLVSNLNLSERWLEIGTKIGGADFTKAHTSFKLPFPDELRPLLLACGGGRREGPLLRCRQAFSGRFRFPTVESTEDLSHRYDKHLSVCPTDTVQCDNDRKAEFRRLLTTLGGTSEDRLAAECKMLLKHIGAPSKATLYTLRSSVSTAMERSGMAHLYLRYLTSHSVDDIMNVYIGLDPVKAMQRYFVEIRPLLDAITARTLTLGLTKQAA